MCVVKEELRTKYLQADCATIAAHGPVNPEELVAKAQWRAAPLTPAWTG